MMRTILTAAGALMLGAAPLWAGGIERAPQSIAILFEEGNYAEISVGGVDPTVKGKDLRQYGPDGVTPIYPGGTKIGDVTKGYAAFGLSYKHQFNPNLSAALIIEQPFGADVGYLNALDGGSPLLSGTYAEVNTTTYSGLLRYKFANDFSVHGGIRGSHANGKVGLTGLAYGAISGYEVKFDKDWAAGYIIGGAYELPQYGARVSLTYNSSIEHDFDTTETVGANKIKSSTKVKTPQSVLLEGQTGLNQQTLLFGSVRWVKWSEFKVKPQTLRSAPPAGFGVADGLVSLEDTTTWTIGVGRRFTENWSGTASFQYEDQRMELVSPLAPTEGRKGITLAAIYEKDKIKVTAGVSYFDLTAAKPETGTPDVARAKVGDSYAWAAGVRIGYRF
ncbi:OmpP1/FadL family transporter [Paracoccus sp. (in: a-proteobacteria)]|uniref:OmpP1/FadL family transporter n=1 Tax=Paracoccus sp. TaxID=267 RepID=UPI003A871091